MFWIVRRRPRRRKKTLDAATAAQVEELRRQAKEYLPGRLNYLANLF